MRCVSSSSIQNANAQPGTALATLYLFKHALQKGVSFVTDGGLNYTYFSDLLRVQFYYFKQAMGHCYLHEVNFVGSLSRIKGGGSVLGVYNEPIITHSLFSSFCQ